MHLAAAAGNYLALSKLIQSAKREVLDLQTVGGETAIYKAIQFCKSDCLSLLLEAKADIALTTLEGDSCLEQA